MCIELKMVLIHGNNKKFLRGCFTANIFEIKC